MNIQKLQNRTIKLIAKVILGFIVGISFGFGIGKLVKEKIKSTASIEKSIQHTSFETYGKTGLVKIIT